MNTIALTSLCSRAWSMTALGLIANGVPARISPLAAAAGCGRPAMTASIQHLVALGLLQKNPGHGHPLRPEFRLSAQGEQLAASTGALFGAVPQAVDRALLRTKWALPTLDLLGREQRYAHLRTRLAPITDRSLTLCLKQLTRHDWIERRVETDAVPPAVLYRSVGLGKKVSGIMDQLPDLTLPACG